MNASFIPKEIKEHTGATNPIEDKYATANCHEHAHDFDDTQDSEVTL